VSRLRCERRREVHAALRGISAARTASADPWLAERPPPVESWGGRFDSAVTDPSDPVVTTVVDAAEAVTGSPRIVEGVTYGAHLRLLVNVGERALAGTLVSS